MPLAQLMLRICTHAACSRSSIEKHGSLLPKPGACTEARCMQAEAATAGRKQVEADAAAAAKAHEALLGSEREHYSSLLQKARTAQVR